MGVPIPIEFRLLDKIDFTRGDCWEWVGKRDRKDYGRVRFDGRVAPAHRIVYELLVGPIGTDLDLDHLCRVHRCVNPAHLEPVTRRVNTLRGIGVAAQCAAKTHCPKGHPLSGDNLYAYPNGKRRCRTCKREQSNAEYARRNR